MLKCIKSNVVATQYIDNYINWDYKYIDTTEANILNKSYKILILLTFILTKTIAL